MLHNFIDFGRSIDFSPQWFLSSLLVSLFVCSQYQLTPLFSLPSWRGFCSSYEGLDSSYKFNLLICRFSCLFPQWVGCSYLGYFFSFIETLQCIIISSGWQVWDAQWFSFPWLIILRIFKDFIFTFRLELSFPLTWVYLCFLGIGFVR